MSASIQCQCGKRYRLQPAMRGKILNCPSCGNKIKVPASDPGQPSSSVDPMATPGIGLPAADDDPLGLGGVPLSADDPLAPTAATHADVGPPAVPVGAPVPPTGYAAQPVGYSQVGKSNAGRPSNLKPLVVAMAIAVPTIVFIIALGVGAVMMLGSKTRIVNETADEQTAGDDPDFSAQVLDTSNEVLPRDLHMKREVELSNIESVRLSPSGTIFAVNSSESAGVAWAVRADTIILQYPRVLGFAREGTKGAGHEHKGEEVYLFERFNDKSGRITYRDIDSVGITGQFSGNDDSFILALPEVSYLANTSGSVLHELPHDPIPVDPQARWTADLSRRFHYQPGSLRVYHEITGEDEEILADQLTGSPRAAFAPDENTAVISNGRKLIVYRGNHDSSITTIQLDEDLDLLGLDISRSGSIAALVYDFPSSRIRDAVFDEEDVNYEGNITIVDLRLDTPRIVKTLPYYATHVALNSIGNQLFAARPINETHSHFTKWDLDVGGVLPDVLTADVGGFRIEDTAGSSTDIAGNDPPSNNNDVADSNDTNSRTIRRTDPELLEHLPKVGREIFRSAPFPTEQSLENLSGSDDLSILGVKMYGGFSGDVYIVDVEADTIKPLESEDFHRVGPLVLSPDGQRLFSGGDVFDTATMRPIAILDDVRDQVELDGYVSTGGTFSADGSQLLVYAFEMNLMWDIDRDRMTKVPTFSDDLFEFFFTFGSDVGLSVAYGADYDNKLIELNLGTGNRRTIPVALDESSYIRIFADAGYATAHTGDEQLTIVNLQTGENDRLDTFFPFLYDSFAIDDAGSLAVARRAPNNLLDPHIVYEILDMSKDEPEIVAYLNTVKDDASLVSKDSVIMSSDGKRVATINGDRTVSVWELELE